MSGITENAPKPPVGTGARSVDETNSKLPIAIQHKADILQQVREGVRLKDIARKLGVTKSAITHALSDDTDYIKAKSEYHDSRLDDAEQMILDADDSTSQARARSYWQAVSWRASKEQRDIYGDRPDQSSSGVTIVINTQDSRGVLIQGEGGDVRAGGGELVPVPCVCDDPSTAK